MKKNQIFRLIGFCLCLVVVVSFLCGIFHFDKAPMRRAIRTYSTLPKNTVDVVVIGTSGINNYYYPGLVYNDYGLTTYACTIDGMRPWHVLPMLKYSLQYQSPKLAVIDMRPFTDRNNENSFQEIRSRYFNEMFPMFSYYRFYGVNQSLRYLSKLTDTSRFDMTYYLNVLRYHTMWQNTLDFNVLKNDYYYPFGYRVFKHSFSTKKLPESVYSTESTPPLWYAIECLNEVLDYAKKKDIELLFVSSPYSITKEQSTYFNGLHEIFDQRNISYLDFNTPENDIRYPFDKAKDFRNVNHTNHTGAVKFTKYLAEYLLENYSLPDRRNDSSCDYFASAYEKTEKLIKKISKGVK